MTNAPIGIPSGWEEIAAWFLYDDARYLGGEIRWEDMRFHKPYDAEMLEDGHDWRVEE